MNIEVVVLTVTRDGVTVTAINENADAREEYRRSDSATGLDCVSGNFSNEQIFGDRDGLVSSLTDLVVAAGIVLIELNKP